jgi:hypothetical protein
MAWAKAFGPVSATAREGDGGEIDVLFRATSSARRAARTCHLVNRIFIVWKWKLDAAGAALPQWGLVPL